MSGILSYAELGWVMLSSVGFCYGEKSYWQIMINFMVCQLHEDYKEYTCT